MISLELQIVLAFLLDALIGDPQWFPHPVRGMGTVAAYFERMLRRVLHSEYIAGIGAVAGTIGISVGAAFGLIQGAEQLHPAFGDVARVYCIYACVALRDLRSHANRVYRALTANTLGSARHAVSMIVGRDTDDLDESAVAKATIESVAESFVDGVAAPLFYAALFGPLGAVAYRAINTLDSMFGHRNERYQRFGWAAAKLDDCANYIPCRLSVPFLVFAAGLTGHSPRSAYRILRRDGRNHASPNAGLPEAALAGALEVQLGGPSSYFGKLVNKPTIGDAVRAICPSDIRRTNRMVTVATIAFLACAVSLRFVATESFRSTLDRIAVQQFYAVLRTREEIDRSSLHVQNPKSEYRNPKQIQNKKLECPKRISSSLSLRHGRPQGVFDICNLVI